MKAGIKCGACKRKHATVAQVRLCYARKMHQAQDELEQELAMERTFDAAIQQQEREEDAAVAAYKAYRDSSTMGRTRRQRPW